jgi:hypothetical protein
VAVPWFGAEKEQEKAPGVAVRGFDLLAAGDFGQA